MMWAKTGLDLQRSKDPSDGFGYMPDIWDDHCGSRCHLTKCRAMCQRGLPVLLDHRCGVPIGDEGLHVVCLLSILVRCGHADSVCSGEERASHSNLVRQRMVGVKVQIPVCVCLFSKHGRGQRAISVADNPGVQKCVADQRPPQ